MGSPSNENLQSLSSLSFKPLTRGEDTSSFYALDDHVLVACSSHCCHTASRTLRYWISADKAGMINRTLYTSSLDVNEKPEPNTDHIYGGCAWAFGEKKQKDEQSASPADQCLSIHFRGQATW